MDRWTSSLRCRNKQSVSNEKAQPNIAKQIKICYHTLMMQTDALQQKQTPEQNTPSPLFFELYQPQLREVLSIVGVPETAMNSLGEAVDATQPWVKGDHSRPLHTFHVEEANKPALRELYDQLGLVRERPLPAGHYDQIVVLGAVQSGNNRRLRFVADALRTDAQTDGIVLLGGQRRMFAERETEEVDANIEAVIDSGKHDKLVAKFEKFGADNIWETDLIRLAAAEQLGDLTLRRLHVRLANADPLGRYEFALGDLPVTLLHTLAVERNGEPRHNTEACIEDWVKTLQPKQGSRVGFICANPHMERTTRAAQHVLNRLGRSDIQLIPAGPAAPEGIGDSMYLGEIARLLYEDQRQVTVAA